MIIINFTKYRRTFKFKFSLNKRNITKFLCISNPIRIQLNNKLTINLVSMIPPPSRQKKSKTPCADVVAQQGEIEDEGGGRRWRKNENGRICEES